MEKLVNFGPFKGPTQRVIQRWFDDATVHHSSLCPSMQLAWCSAGSASDPEAWPGQSWEPYVCMIWGNSLSISQMQTPIPLEDVPLSLFLQIIFFFFVMLRFFPTLPSLLSYPPPSIPYFYFPLLTLKAPKPGIDYPLTHEFNSSGGKVLSGWEWTWGRAGWVNSGSTLSPGYWIEDVVWGTSQPRLSLEVSSVHSSHPASVLCFMSWSQMKQKLKPKSRDKSSGRVGIFMWNARLMWALCASHLPSQQNVQVEGQSPTLPLTRGQGSGHSHVLGSETSSWITAVFTLLDILHTCDSWLFSQIWKKSVKEQCASADRWAS